VIFYIYFNLYVFREQMGPLLSALRLLLRPVTQIWVTWITT